MLNCKYLDAEYHIKLHVAKTLLGQSSVLVSVPPPNAKLLELDDWSVIVFPSFKIVKPLVTHCNTW